MASDPSKNGLLGDCEPNFELLFSTNPLAMYVCDRETLEFLEVNASAERQYGYTREEFLKMKITDIRPSEDIPRLLDVARTDGMQPLQFLGQWRHRRKNGQVFEVEVTAQGNTSREGTRFWWSRGI